jgi:hypothetical protein
MADFNSKLWRRLNDLVQQGTHAVNASIGTEDERVKLLAILCDDIERTVDALREAEFVVPVVTEIDVPVSAATPNVKTKK